MVTSYQGHLKEHKRVEYPKAAQFMAKSFVKVKPDTNVYEAMDLILQAHATGAAVVDDEDGLIGILSEKDCLKLATEDAYESIPHGGPVKNYMAINVLTVGPDAGLNKVAELFVNTPFKKIPVLENGKLVGMIRRHDVLKTLQKFYKDRMDYMREH